MFSRSQEKALFGMRRLISWMGEIKPVNYVVLLEYSFGRISQYS